MNSYKSLAKSELLEFGFKSAHYDRGGWVIVREFTQANGKSQEMKLHPKTDGTFAFSFKGKTVKMDLKRFVWVWYFDDLTSEDAVVLIDGKEKNLSVGNLKKIKRSQVSRFLSRSKEEIDADVLERDEKLRSVGVGVPVQRRKK